MAPVGSVVRRLLGAQTVVVLVGPVPRGFGLGRGVRPRRGRRRDPARRTSAHGRLRLRIPISHATTVPTRPLPVTRNGAGEALSG